MHTSERGVRLIENFEGFSSYQYNDGVGVMTIGFGTTAADISPLPRYCTRAQAETWLRQKLAQKYEPSVNALGAKLNQNQFDALVSLAYNCGPGSMQWQIGRDVRAGNYQAAANDFLHYVYAGGRVLQGLVNRRQAERSLFLTPVTVTDKYAIFPRHRFFAFGSEHDVVVRTDGALQHPQKYRAYLKGSLRGQLIKLRNRIWTVAHRSHPAAWNDDRKLGHRWQELNNRIKAIDRIP